MKIKHLITPWAAGFMTVCMMSTAGAAQEPNRTILPIMEPDPPTYSELDVRNTEKPPRFEVKAPEQDPNQAAFYSSG